MKNIMLISAVLFLAACGKDKEPPTNTKVTKSPLVGVDMPLTKEESTKVIEAAINKQIKQSLDEVKSHIDKTNVYQNGIIKKNIHSSNMVLLYIIGTVNLILFLVLYVKLNRIFKKLD